MDSFDMVKNGFYSLIILWAISVVYRIIRDNLEERKEREKRLRENSKEGKDA